MLRGLRQIEHYEAISRFVSVLFSDPNYSSLSLSLFLCFMLTKECQSVMDWLVAPFFNRPFSVASFHKMAFVVRTYMLSDTRVIIPLETLLTGLLQILIGMFVKNLNSGVYCLTRSKSP